MTLRQQLVILLAAIAPLCATAASPNTYAGQQARDIKALSAEEAQGLLAGKGMGLARAAELNGYPGPMHVLQLSTELSLSEQQTMKTKAIYDTMASQATSLGRELVDEERALDILFARKQITTEALARAMRRIGDLQGRIREAHLAAHLAQVAILTPEQVGRYMSLRGYGDQAPKHDHQHMHQH